jgi:hypothetical protein
MVWRLLDFPDQEEEQEEMTIIKLQDFRHPSSRVCLDARHLFFSPYGLDWRRFCREGMTVDELRSPGQHLDLIDRLEAVAKEREARNG